MFGITYADGYHVEDLLGNAEYATQGLQLFESALDKWLPCFKTHSISSSNATTTGTGNGSSNGGSSPTGTPTGSGTASASASHSGAAVAMTDSRNVQFGAAAALIGAFALL